MRDITGDKDSSRANKLKRGWPGSPVVDSTAQASKAWRSLVTLATLQDSPLYWFEEKTPCGFLRQAVLYGPVGVGVLVTPSCLKLSQAGNSSCLGVCAAPPGGRGCIISESVTRLVGSVSNLPFPTFFSFLPPPTPSCKPLFSDHRPLPSPPGY